MGWMHSAGVALGFVEPRTQLELDRSHETFAAEPDSVDAAIAAKVAEQVGASTWSQPVTREFALQVPAVLRGRNVLCSISTLSLRHYRLSDRVRVESPLLSQIDPNVPNVVTLAQTVDDLIFHGTSWWQYLRTDRDGFPTSARHVDFESVSLDPPAGVSIQHLPSDIDPASVVWIKGKPVNGTRMVRFDSPNPALLVSARKAIRRAALLDAAAAMYAENPRALEYFTPTEDADSDDEQIVADIRAWVQARRSRSVGYVPSSLKLNTLEAISPADLQLVQLQARAALDIANALGLDPEDLGVSTTSRTYNNATDRRRDKINDTFGPYIRAIVERLSMNDVTRRGYGVEFDLTEYLKADPATQAQVAATYHGLGALEVDEIRADIGRPALEATPAPAPSAVSRTPQTPAAAAASRADVARYGHDRTPEGSVTIPATFSAATAAPAAADAPSIRRVTFEVPVGSAEFKVDVEKRTVSGLAVPYGEVTSDWRQIAFAAGSIEVPTPLSRVKAIMNHYGSLLGVAASTTETDSGLYAKLSVAKTTAGDEALALADAGALDGMSVGVDIHEYTVDTETEVTTVTRATLREISLTPFPAFDSARVDKVNLTSQHASQKGTPVMTVADPGTTDATAPAAVAPDTSALEARFAAMLDARFGAPAAPAPAAPPAANEAPVMPAASAEFVAQVAALVSEQVTVRETVNPTGRASVSEPSCYRFDGRKGSAEFSTDVFDVIRNGSGEARTRLKKFMAETFVSKANVVDINPSRQRPDLWVDEKEFSTPLWDSIVKGTLEDSTPFILPKFNTSTGVIADHVEGTEPSLGTYTTTSQTITPGALSGKVDINREVVDQGGNPQLSTILWAKIRRAYAEALEAKAAALLAGLSPTALAITTGVVDVALAKELRAKLAALQFVRGGFRFRDLKLQVDLYTALSAASDTTGRALFPSVGGQNADGSADSLFGTLNTYGLAGMPAWALGATSTASSKSYLYDRADVHGWATPPTDLNLADADVAKVYIGVFGYQATACTDLTGVRALTYDPVV